MTSSLLEHLFLLGGFSITKRQRPSGPKKSVYQQSQLALFVFRMKNLRIISSSNAILHCKPGVGSVISQLLLPLPLLLRLGLGRCSLLTVTPARDVSWALSSFKWSMQSGNWEMMWSIRMLKPLPPRSAISFLTQLMALLPMLKWWPKDPPSSTSSKACNLLADFLVFLDSQSMVGTPIPSSRLCCLSGGVALLCNSFNIG